MAISCDHPRPKLNLPGRTPQRLPFSPPTFIPTSSPADMARALLEAFRGISAALAQIGQRRTVVPLIEDIEAREGQIITGVADGQVIKLPEAVQDGAIGQVTILLSDVKTPATVVHPDGSTDTLTEPGIYEFALGSEGESTWATPPGVIGGIRAISAGTTSATSGTVRFSNANGLAFGLAGNTLTGSYTVPAPVSAIAGVSTVTLGALSFSNAGGITWSLITLPGSTIIAGTVVSATSLSFSNANNVTFGIAGSTLTASVVPPVQVSIQGIGAVANVTRIVFTNLGNVSFSGTLGAGNATVIANVASTADPQIGLVSHVGGNSVSSVTRLAFSNASNVTWSVSTAANAATIIASVAAGGGGGGIAASAAGSSQSAGTVVWSNSNNVSFGMNGSTITATVSTAAGLSAVSAGTLGIGAQLTALSFSNANNFSWTLSTNAGTTNAGFIIGQPFFMVSEDGGNSVNATRMVFTDANNVTFGVLTGASGATIAASATVASTQASIRISAGTTSVLSSGFTFSNSHNVSWTMNNGTLVASASFAAGGGGVAVAVPGSTVTNNTVVFSNETQINAAAGLESLGNVRWDLNGSTMGATALMRVNVGTNITQTAGDLVTKVHFSDGGGITWDRQTATDGNGRICVVSAASVSTVAPTVNYWRNVSENDIVAVNLAGLIGSMLMFPLGIAPFNGNMTMDTLEVLHVGVANLTTSSPQWGMTLRGGLYSLNNSTQVSRVNSFSTVFSSASLAGAGSQSRNNLYGNNRWLTVGSAAWGAAPALSDNINYWMGLAWTTSGAGVITQVIVQRPPAAIPSLNGVMGVSSATASPEQRGLVPFNGFVNTTSPPTTVGTAGILAALNASAWFIPILQIRDAIGI